MINDNIEKIVKENTENVFANSKIKFVEYIDVNGNTEIRKIRSYNNFNKYQ